jgi:hypothetical protein
MFDFNQDGLRRLLQALTGGGSDDMEGFEPAFALGSEQRKEWDEIQNLHDEAKSMLAEAQARSSLFWVKLERAVKEAGFESDSLRVDTGVVYRKPPSAPDIPDDLPRLEDSL